MGDIVKSNDIKEEVEMKSMRLNIMRRIGKDIGGMIVDDEGEEFEFILNELRYWEIIIELWKWKKKKEK